MTITIYINGYFTAEHINGVPRYAAEIVKRLDSFELGEATLVIPPNAIHIPQLEHISILTKVERGELFEPESAIWVPLYMVPM